MLCPLEFYLISILLNLDTKETSKSKFNVKVHTVMAFFAYCWDLLCLNQYKLLLLFNKP